MNNEPLWISGNVALEKAAIEWFNARKRFMDAEFVDLKYEGERKDLLEKVSYWEQTLAAVVRKVINV